MLLRVSPLAPPLTVVGMFLGAFLSPSSQATPGSEGAASLAAEPQIRPLPWLGSVCSTSSLPRVSGGWVFGCDSEGRPNRALHLLSDERVQFGAPQGAWGLSEGVVLDLHGKAAFLPGGEEMLLTPISSALHAPLVSHDQTLVFSGVQGIETMPLGGTRRTRIEESTPAPWYAPAVNDHGVFWVELHNGKEEIHWMPHQGGSSEPLAAGSKPLRHVAADGDYVAWMSDTSVFIRDLSTGLTAEQSGRFHSNQSLAISGSLVCFESLNEEDIDIFCSNGFHLQRPGHQRNPSIWKDWLVFHEGDQALLYGPIK